jgi:hypothetical protein
MPVYWVEKYVQYKRIQWVWRAGVEVSILMSITNICRRPVMHICTSQYRHPLSAIIPDHPVPSHSACSTFLCSAKILRFGFIDVHVAWRVAVMMHEVCWIELTESSSYGAPCLLDGTD